MTKEEIFVKLIQNIPYPNQISEVDLSSESEAIRFIWCGDKFRVSLTKMVEEVDGQFLKRSNIALLLETLLFPVA